jgi:hypothetical protein
MSFDVLAVGERRLQAFFDDLPAVLEARLYRAMEAIASRMAAAVRAAEPVRTGTLRAETQPFVWQSDAAVTAGVVVASDSKVEHGKAAALEYGAHRPTTVREHWAVRSSFWGRYGAAEAVLIEEYRRRVNIGADRYLRGPFAAMEGEIIAALEAAVDEAARAS